MRFYTENKNTLEANPKKQSFVSFSYKVCFFISAITIYLKASTQSSSISSLLHISCRRTRAEQTPSHKQHLFSAQSKCQSRPPTGSWLISDFLYTLWQQRGSPLAGLGQSRQSCIKEGAEPERPIRRLRQHCTCPPKGLCVCECEFKCELIINHAFL